MYDRTRRDLRALQRADRLFGWPVELLRLALQTLLWGALAFVAFGIYDFAIPELRAFIAEVHYLRETN